MNQRLTSTRQSCLFALGRELLLGPASGFRVLAQRSKHLNLFLTGMQNSQRTSLGYVRDDFDCPMTSHQVGHRDSRRWVATITHSPVAQASTALAWYQGKGQGAVWTFNPRKLLAGSEHCVEVLHRVLLAAFTSGQRLAVTKTTTCKKLEEPSQ